MDDPLAVGMVEGLEDLLHHEDGVVGREALGVAQKVLEGPPVQVGHDDMVVLRPQLRVQDGEDVGVLHRHHHLRLVDEPLDELLVGGDMGEDLLDGHRPARDGVGGEEDGGHPPGGQVPGDGIAADSRRERGLAHGWIVAWE